MLNLIYSVLFIMRFFKKDIENQRFYECGQAEAEFIEIFWSWQSYAIPLVLGLSDAIEKYKDRFIVDNDSCSVITPNDWHSLHEHNAQYCQDKEKALLLTQATLAVRPPL